MNQRRHAALSGDGNALKTGDKVTFSPSTWRVYETRLVALHGSQFAPPQLSGAEESWRFSERKVRPVFNFKINVSEPYVQRWVESQPHSKEVFEVSLNKTHPACHTWLLEPVLQECIAFKTGNTQEHESPN